MFPEHACVNGDAPPAAPPASRGTQNGDRTAIYRAAPAGMSGARKVSHANTTSLGGRAHRARRRRAPCRLLEQSWNRGRQRRARLSAQDWHRHAAGSDRRDGAHAGRFVRRQPWRARDVRPRAGERKGGRGRRRHARLHAERRRVRGRRMERGRGRRGLRRRLSGADVAEQLQPAVLPLVRAGADDARQGRGALDSAAMVEYAKTTYGARRART